MDQKRQTFSFMNFMVIQCYNLHKLVWISMIKCAPVVLSFGVSSTFIVQATVAVVILWATKGRTLPPHLWKTCVLECMRPFPPLAKLLRLCGRIRCQSVSQGVKNLLQSLGCVHRPVQTGFQGKCFMCPMESWEGSCGAPVMSWQMRAGLGVESAVLLSDGWYHM